SRALEEATVGGPPALEQAIFSLPHQARLLENATEFMRLLRPSAAALITVAPPLAHAVSVGAVNLRAATALNTELAASAKALQPSAETPVVTLARADSPDTLHLAKPLLAGLAPAQAYCKYLTLAFRNVASLLAENVGVGPLARAGIVLAPAGPNNIGYPSSAPANGPSVEKAFGGTTIIDNNHVSSNPYPNVAGPGQPKLCEAGNEIYIKGK